MKVTLFRDLPTERWPSMERYADELAAALSTLHYETHSYVLRRPLPNLAGRAGTLLNYAWRSFAYPLAARSQQSDVNHIIDHSYAHLIDTLDERRTVVTCHDIAPLVLEQQGRGLSRRLWDRSFRAMLRAAYIIADSAHTRAEILRCAPYPPDRISVVPLAVHPAFFEPASPQAWSAARGLTGRAIILHVGSCQPRKNVETLLHALVLLNNETTTLVQIGGQFSADQSNLIDRLQLRAQVHQIKRASEADLRSAYQAAAVLAFPSIYEGFGFPVLEALASGTPVVCANATSLPEITGEAALLHEPRDAQQLAEQLRRVLTDRSLADDLRRRGRERARLFTWERTARETLAVYQQVLSR